MKIRIDGWAWISLEDLGSDQADWLRKNLTVADVKQRRPVLHRAYLEEDGMLGIPRSFFRGSMTKQHELQDVSSEGNEWPDRSPAKSGTPWMEYQDEDVESLTLVDSVLGEKTEDFFTDDQKKGITEILRSMATDRDGIALFQSEQSAAKICASVIRSLKKKTLIVTPSGTSFSMWQTVLGRFLPDASIGTIRRGECDVDDRHIVLTTVDDLGDAISKCQVARDEFGFIISHHIHRLDPMSWASAIGFFSASRRIGICESSAFLSTGLFRVYSYHLGSPIFSAKKDWVVPGIRRVWSSWKISSWVRANPQFISKAALVDQMCLNSNYNKHVVEQILLALKADRKIVVFSEKVSHLKTLKMSIEAEWSGSIKTTDFVIEGMSSEDIDGAVGSDVILTTFGFAKSFPEVTSVDTVVLATPTRDPLVAANVCLFKDPDKKEPVIVDMRCDEVPACKDYGRSRDDAYRRSYGEEEGMSID